MTSNIFNDIKCFTPNKNFADILKEPYSTWAISERVRGIQFLYDYDIFNHEIKTHCIKNDYMCPTSKYYNGIKSMIEKNEKKIHDLFHEIQNEVGKYGIISNIYINGYIIGGGAYNTCAASCPPIHETPRYNYCYEYYITELLVNIDNTIYNLKYSLKGELCEKVKLIFDIKIYFEQNIHKIIKIFEKKFGNTNTVIPLLTGIDEPQIKDNLMYGIVLESEDGKKFEITKENFNNIVEYINKNYGIKEKTYSRSFKNYGMEHQGWY